MYMSARRIGATELPREVAFHSHAAAAAGSLACIALANSCWPGSFLDFGLGTAGGGSSIVSRLAAVAAGAGVDCVSTEGFGGATTAVEADGVAAVSFAGVVGGSAAGASACCWSGLAAG